MKRFPYHLLKLIYSNISPNPSQTVIIAQFVEKDRTKRRIWQIHVGADGQWKGYMIRGKSRTALPPAVVDGLRMIAEMEGGSA